MWFLFYCDQNAFYLNKMKWNEMHDFICLGFAELLGTQNKLKLRNFNYTN